VRVSVLSGLASAASAFDGAQRTEVTPIQKVVELLNGMVAKGKAEKHDEEVAFAKFHQWCDSTRASTTKSIKEAAAQIEQLTADIAKAEADAEELAGDIKELEKSIADDEAELKEATGVREKDRSDYLDTHKDLSESVDAIERAIAVLKSREKDVPQSLLQVRDAPGIPREAKAAIESFLAMSSGEPGDGVPEANAYEFQSGGVVALLEKLRLKFQDQRLAVEKEEMSAKANFEVLHQTLTDNIAEENKVKTKKTETKAQRLADAATAKGELQMTEAGKAEDEKTLSDTLASCHAKSEEFEKNQVLRAEEVQAIEKATKILLSDEVSGTAGKHLPTLVQLASRHTAAALVQLRGNESPEEAQRRERVVAYLQGRAAKLGSKYLSLVATHASGDPFAKVKKMIKDLIVKLMEQANSEADHKAYCDTELATNKQTREIKQSEVDELSASIEKHSADSAQLGEEIQELTDAVAELRRQQAEATKAREADKARNAKTVEEAKAAQVAVERATKVLKDFYAKAADATLLQNSEGLSAEMKQATNAPYKGMQSENGGIMGFLEVILSDFARLESETTAAEDQAANAYEKFMDESNEDIAVKETETEHKENKKQDTDAKILNLKKELKLTQEELDAALAYFDKLKPDCVDQNLSYDKRVQMREEEIQSLKEALQILNQQDLA